MPLVYKLSNTIFLWISPSDRKQSYKAERVLINEPGGVFMKEELVKQSYKAESPLDNAEKLPIFQAK